MRSLCLGLLGLSLLAGCSPTTPLFIAQIGTQEVVEYKTLKTNRMTAAIEEDGDLLTYSAQAIRDNKSAQAEALYLSGYQDKKLGDQVRAIALYQIGLIYMCRYNDDRDDNKALNYFYQVHNEFPATLAAQRAATVRLIAAEADRIRRTIDEDVRRAEEGLKHLRKRAEVLVTSQTSSNEEGIRLRQLADGVGAKNCHTAGVPAAPEDASLHAVTRWRTYLTPRAIKRMAVAASMAAPSGSASSSRLKSAVCRWRGAAPGGFTPKRNMAPSHCCVM